MAQRQHLFQEALDGSACIRGTTRPSLTGHDVQFYRTDAYLINTVADFLADGVRAGQPILVVATPAHRAAFAENLRARGLDSEELFSGRVAVWLDARETLASFMERGHPDRDLFMATVGRVFETLIAKRSYLIVRAFGEMVDLLWKEGNAAGAIELEKLWNELGSRYRHSLLCAYSLDNFLHDSNVEGFRHVCDHHTHALPMEREA